MLIIYRIFVCRGNFPSAHSVLSSALSVCEVEDFGDLKLHADVLYTLAHLSAKTNCQPSTILKHTLEHLNYRIKLNDGNTESRNLLSMAHCALAQAYMLNGNYAESIKNCHRTRKVMIDSSEQCIWVQLADIYETWSLMATARLDEAETVIVRQYETQVANHDGENGNYSMYVQRTRCFALNTLTDFSKVG